MKPSYSVNILPAANQLFAVVIEPDIIGSCIQLHLLVIWIMWVQLFGNVLFGLGSYF